MANNEMIKRAYAEGAYAALKEAGYDHQTAVHYATEMAKQAQGMPAVPPTPDLPGTIQGLLGTGRQTGPNPRQAAALAGARGPRGLVPPNPNKLPPLAQ